MTYPIRVDWALECSPTLVLIVDQASKANKALFIL